jgi:hypothetical protein
MTASMQREKISRSHDAEAVKAMQKAAGFFVTKSSNQAAGFSLIADSLPQTRVIFLSKKSYNSNQTLGFPDKDVKIRGVT